MPPFMSVDPAFGAEMRKVGRGLSDAKEDYATAEHFADRNFAQAMRNIKTKYNRARGSTNREASRGLRSLDRQEADENLSTQRRREDFGVQLANIGRQFAQLGVRQAEGQNAAGVLGGGTSAAAGVVRAQNQRLAEAPIHTAAARNEENLRIALGRIGEGRSEIGEDRDRILGQQAVDRRVETRGERIQDKRERFTRKRKLDRQIREALNTRADLRNQAIFAARERRPGTFTTTGHKKNKKGKR